MADLQRCGWNIPHKRLAQRAQPVGSKPRGQSSVAAVVPRDARVGKYMICVHNTYLINVHVLAHVPQTPVYACGWP